MVKWLSALAFLAMPARLKGWLLYCEVDITSADFSDNS